MQDDRDGYLLLIGWWRATGHVLILPPVIFDRLAAVAHGPIPAIRSISIQERSR